jgi:phage internal scaffolding protein
METGIMPPTNTSPQYGDVSGHNFQEAQNQIALAKTLFEELPEHVRSRFENEPYKFLQFAQDENNYDQMVEMGLANAIPSEDNALQTDSKGSPFVSGKDEVAPSKESPSGDS